ncbi:MAG: 2-dehydro-3-deoxy-6-phosphogalactonate aldolase, partial [Mesorhizobium sp.]
LKPDEAVAIGRAIFEAGIEAIEVPLNSPDPFSSIARIVEALPATALVGAGTVLTPADVDGLQKAGGRLLVSPDMLVGAVGGVSEKDFAGYKAAGVNVFGLGSSLFKPDMSVDEVAARANAATAAWDAAFGAAR